MKELGEQLISVDVIDDPKIILHPQEALESLKELSDSIKAQGQLQNIMVRKIGDRFQLIIGHRRTRAARLYGIPKLKAKVVECTEQEAMLASATENLQRLEQDVIEEAKLYAKLQQDYKMSSKDIAEKFGKSAVYVTSRLNLLGLREDVQQLVKDKRITLGAAAELYRVTDREQQLIVASDFVDRPLTVQRAKDTVTAFLEFSRTMKDSKPEDIIQEARKEPMARCAICNELHNITKIKGYAMCDNCHHGFIYYKERERRVKQNVESNDSN